MERYYSYRPVLRLVCDTSFLLEVVRRRLFTDIIDRFTPLEIFIVKPVYKELYRLKERVPEANVILSLLEKYDFIKLLEYGEGDVADEAVLRFACENGYVLATTDRGLRRRAMERGCRVLFIRGSWLSME